MPAAASGQAFAWGSASANRRPDETKRPLDPWRPPGDGSGRAGTRRHVGALTGGDRDRRSRLAAGDFDRTLNPQDRRSGGQDLDRPFGGAGRRHGVFGLDGEAAEARVLNGGPDDTG